MPNLQVKSRTPDADGRVLQVTPESAGWEYVGFEVYKLAQGQELAGATGDREVGLVLLSGKVEAESDGRQWGEIGQRMDIFEQTPATVLYLPPESAYSLRAVTAAEVAVCSSPAEGKHPARLIRPEDVETMNRGSGNQRRRIHNLLPDSEPADHLLLVEVYTPGGNWSSYPPHKHEVDDGERESRLEETYYHRINPSQGFAFQRVYNDDRSLNEALCVEDGDCVMIPGGYHPVGAAAGYDLYYLNVMAGNRRQWLFSNDPDHAWLYQGIRSE